MTPERPRLPPRGETLREARHRAVQQMRLERATGRIKHFQRLIGRKRTEIRPCNVEQKWNLLTVFLPNDICHVVLSYLDDPEEVVERNNGDVLRSFYPRGVAPVQLYIRPKSEYVWNFGQFYVRKPYKTGIQPTLWFPVWNKYGIVDRYVRFWVQHDGQQTEGLMMIWEWLVSLYRDVSTMVGN